MMSFKHVSRINVSLWGERVGTIVESLNRGVFAFRYEKKFLQSGIEISPLMMPLRAEPYVFPDLPRAAYAGLPPIFADSLPDTFGTGLIDHWLKEHGLRRDEITPLDRLAYLGRRTMGALTYEPDLGPGGRPAVFDLRKLVESARQALNGELASAHGDDALREIIRLGSSAGGAQAKAVVGWNRRKNTFLFGDRELPEGYEHWLIKFTPVAYPWRGEAEYAHYRKALAAGVKMSESCLYELDGVKHFMTRRFDREGGERYHLATFSALAHIPAETPPEHRRYEQLLVVADELGLGYEASEQLFRRMTFNVLSGEFDDHTKNFSFLLKRGGSWGLAPAYDLTGSNFPSEDPWSAQAGSHQLSVNGKRQDITDGDLLAVADRFGIGTARSVIGEVRAALGMKGSQNAERKCAKTPNENAPSATMKMRQVSQ